MATDNPTPDGLADRDVTRTDRFVPALRFATLTPAYDAVVRWTARERAVKHALLESAHLDDAGRLLDVGCGTGTLAIEAKRRWPSLDVVAIDPDPEVIERARRKASRAGVAVTFVLGSATDLPADDATFDRVASSLVFHHLSSDDKRIACREIARVLTPTGELWLADWVRPSNPLMWVLFWSVRLLDGLDTTRDHAEGRLSDRLEAGGLTDIRPQRRFATPVGTLGILSARRAASPAPPGSDEVPATRQ